MPSFPNGTRVRLVGNAGRTGWVVDAQEEDDGAWIRVRFEDGANAWHPAHELEEPAAIEGPEALFRAGRFGGPETLRQHLVYHKLNGRLADVIYSMGATATDYYPHQFKPVIRFLESPARGILIADEVGLGKTIEAGLIWTEWRARFDARRLLVVCPPHLRENWVLELENRFGVSAKEANAEMVVREIERARRDRHHEFALIASFQGLLPPRGWNELAPDHSSARVRLAHLLDALDEDEPVLDLLVVDEAHYLRNPESQTSKAGKTLASVADRLVLLSATPIMLSNANLWVLLNLLEPDTFDNPAAFEFLVQANAPLVKARELLIGSANPDLRAVRQLLEGAREHPLLRENNQLRTAIEILTAPQDAENPDPRGAALQATERASMLSHVVNRTRKRDVQENRVVRDVRTFRVPLEAEETRFYTQVTELVRDYCAENVVQGEGLLYVMPQRQVSSSMPAALKRWQSDALADEVEWNDSIDRLQGDLEGRSGGGPLSQFLRDNAAQLGSFDRLARIDSKFQLLSAALIGYFAENPDAKVVLFAFFRNTLYYLKERLEKAGISCALICGGMGKKKTAQLAWFAKPDGPQILLSSEVGSEGLNLQFAKVVINYDLPWNPMRVEQRIGRLDRIGQKAERILVWNFVAADTIDERIYDRLFLRLNIFEKALGGMEDVLGDAIAALTKDLFSHHLTPEQESVRIERTAAAIANTLDLNREVEENAPNLTAYQDYILKQVQAARELNRSISAAELQTYVCDYFRNHDAESTLTGVHEPDRRYQLKLSFDTSYAFGEFCQLRGLRTRRAFSHVRPVSLRFELTADDGSSPDEIINQFHPLVRFISEQYTRLEKRALPVIALRLPRGQTAVEPGDFAFHVERWSLTGLRDFEKLSYTAIRLNDATELKDDDAEHLVTSATQNCVLWQNPGADYELGQLWTGLEKQLITAAFKRFRTYRRKIEAENTDRVSLQIELLRRHREKKTNELIEVRRVHEFAGRTNLISATDGKLRKLEERMDRQLRRLNERSRTKAENTTICDGILRVE